MVMYLVPLGTHTIAWACYRFQSSHIDFKCVYLRSISQIPRILGPIVEAVRSLEDMALDPLLGHYVDVGWGGVYNAKMAVLSDFFKVRTLEEFCSDCGHGLKCGIEKIGATVLISCLVDWFSHIK